MYALLQCASTDCVDDEGGLKCIELHHAQCAGKSLDVRRFCVIFIFYFIYISYCNFNLAIFAIASSCFIAAVVVHAHYAFFIARTPLSYLLRVFIIRVAMSV